MGVPRCIDRLMLTLKHDVKEVEKEVIKHKYAFGIEMIRAMEGGDVTYYDAIFDYLFNLFYFRKAFSDVDFKKYIEEFKDMDFRKPAQVCAKINDNYMLFVASYKGFFMDYYGFNNEDPLYMSRKIEGNRREFKEKMLNYGNALS